MKFKDYLNEKVVRSNINFVDIDETLFNTFAKVSVMDKNTKEIKKELSNSEYNSYKLKDDEEFNFDQFRDGKLFKDTSEPIKPMIDRIKRMMDNIKKNSYDSKIIVLTARTDLNDKEHFLQTFKDVGIDIDFKNFYIERSGNLGSGPVEKNKEKVIMKYLNTGEYQIIRMFDDFMPNLTNFINIGDKIEKDILLKVKNKFQTPDNKWVMKFIALHVQDDGKLKKYDEKDVYINEN